MAEEFREVTESEVPILEVHYVTTASAEYQEIVKYKPSPEAIGHVQDVKIMVDATTFISNCKIKVVINGEERVKDQSLVVATTTLGFGQNLVFKGKVDEGIIVYAKSDGTDTMKILGTITGIEIPKKENENSNESLAI